MKSKSRIPTSVKWPRCVVCKQPMIIGYTLGTDGSLNPVILCLDCRRAVMSITVHADFPYKGKRKAVKGEPPKVWRKRGTK